MRAARSVHIRLYYNEVRGHYYGCSPSAVFGGLLILWPRLLLSCVVLNTNY